MKRFGRAIPVLGLALITVSGCSFGMAQSVSDVTHDSAVVHGYIASDLAHDDPDWINPSFAVVVAPAPKVPTLSRPPFDDTTDWAAAFCGTLGSPGDGGARSVDAPLGDVAAATHFASDPQCGRESGPVVGRTGGLEVGTPYNARICATDHTHGSGAPWNCGGVVSFTTRIP